MTADGQPGEGTHRGAAAQLVSENFDLNAAIGGWRGVVESVLPGTVFVTAYAVAGGFRLPVIAAVSAVVVLVAARLIQRTPATQAFGGAVGVVLGAVWAWRAGDPNEYFLPGFWTSAAYAFAMLVTMLVRWPAAGVVVGFLKGWGSAWRSNRLAMTRFQWATGVFVVPFVLRLAVQVPLYLAGATGALGTVKLAMGLPLTALSLWLVWLLVRNVELPATPEDRPQPTE